MTSLSLKKHSLLFAPMEGVTDSYYRSTIHALYPEWDRYSCDFLRIPSSVPYPVKHITKHLGTHDMSTTLREKTIYQILTSPNALIRQSVQDIAKIGAPWLDLNLGCPSKTVCKNKGGSYLLEHLNELKTIITTIREEFPRTFTCKVRVGFKDDSNFENILKLLQDHGVDAVIIHGRTRDELYKGTSNWSYIKRAVKFINIPVIGNGDIWDCDDIEKFYDYTDCHSIMLARSALKTPWLAKLYKEGLTDSPEIRRHEMIKYFSHFYEETLKQNLAESSRIKRLKSVSRYIFDDLPDGITLKRKFLLSKSFEEQINFLRQY